MFRPTSLLPETLAAVLEQSVDCVKLIGPSGNIRWMNRNGQCLMDIDDFKVIDGQQWAVLWPDAAHPTIAAAFAGAQRGEVVRFDAFCPTTQGSPRWWSNTVSAVADADGGFVGFVAISRDVTEVELARQTLAIAAEEMRHRLKNTYAMVGSLMQGIARGDAARESFAREMVDRLVALSAAQTLFVEHDAPRELALLIPALVTAFDSPLCAVTVGPMPDVRIDEGQANAIALVVGELSVNAAKHGAIRHGGSIDVTASLVEASDRPGSPAKLTIVWTERAAQPVAATQRSGSQGLALIERIVRARRGTFDIAWRPDGLTVVLDFALG